MRALRFKQVALSPSFYASWTAFVLLALTASYPIDPYVFGLTSLILAWISLPVIVVGITVTIVAKPLPVRSRIAIGLLLVVTAAAVVTALAILRTFSWA